MDQEVSGFAVSVLSVHCPSLLPLAYVVEAKRKSAAAISNWSRQSTERKAGRECCRFHTAFRRTQMKISARNQLKGTVKNVEHGAVNSEVTIQLPGGIGLVSISTKLSAEQFQIAAG